MWRSLLLLVVCGQWAAGASRGAEVLWDQYGVPHVFAKNKEAMFYALGWAQMHNHANLLLRLYGESRGRAAEYWGADFLEGDRWVRLNNVPERGRQWYKQQTPEFKRDLDAFVAGINEYAAKYPDQIDPKLKRVLPVDGADPLIHTQRVLYFSYIASPSTVAASLRSSPAVAQAWTPEQDVAAGSNAWAVGPAHSASGHSLLLSNPHLIWENFYTFFEVHLNAPGYTIYGSVPVGFPCLRNAFNDNLGWSQTVNTIDGMDLYRLTPKDNGYVFDGAVKPFEAEQQVIKIRQADGTLNEEKRTVQRSVHGPIVATQDGHPIAMRVVGLDRPGLMEQYFAMSAAHNFTEFQAALDKQQIPMFNVTYADREGHIMYLDNGMVPVRRQGNWQYWQGVVPGDTSATLWTQIHPLKDMPRVVDPPSAFVQNTNDPGWNSTIPKAIDPSQYPPYMAPVSFLLRSARSLRMLSEKPKISYEEFIQLKHSTRAELADRILDELLSDVDRLGSSESAAAAKVLRQWDRQTNADSRGAVLFEAFATKWLASPNPYTIPFQLDQPLTTPRGIRDHLEAVNLLEEAVREVRTQYGSLDVPWGQVFQYHRGNLTLPANGGPGSLGIFRTIAFGPLRNGHREQVHGETYVAAVEFSTPVRAQALLGYGNASQPGSKHIEDQLPFMARKELRPTWRTRPEIEAHLEQRELL